MTSLFDTISAASEGRASTADPVALREACVAAIKTVYDPEIPVDVWELGLIYRVDVDEDGKVDIDMTLTAPNCPVADLIPRQVARAVEEVEGVSEVAIKLVWTPAWTKDRMSEEARLTLDMF